ncbi:cAMP-binding protein [Rubellimicrobium mesophilum DSM 19309]|uniref:cAMP-binding protein n=1 Tax=Rubellimicrobium mesophilum DSM 19309 TaxID=442562 RepID=A0A017HVE6_9RHOB|nr:Crp/Fnr family transcriptional regulator [Rubellimicrobium mesophilum]EYD77729.1 cAMP-binding protein [Rubellimicrobium mesophilum DSM 19309]
MPPLHPLLLKLERALPLTPAERTALASVPIRVVEVEADEQVIRTGDRPSTSFMVLEGFLATSKLTPEGRRQIMTFHIPGDLPDLLSLHLEVLDSDIWTLSDCRLAYMEHADLWPLCQEFPRLTAYLWRITLVDASIFREWVLNVGQRPALPRIAHLLCEIMARMEVAGLAHDGSCPFPITQSVLAEATGLSIVHVNRTLQDLRAQGLLSVGRGRLTIHQRAALADLAGFHIEYLHLRTLAPGWASRTTT